MDKWAIVISIFSMLIAAFTFGWNIYRDVIMKPRIKVSFEVIRIVHDSPIGGDTLISLRAVNMGPGQVTISMATNRNTSLWKKITRQTQSWVIIPSFTHPLCFKLPHRLDMAQGAQLVFPYKEDCFLKNEFTHIGILDSFGRVHWAPKEDIQNAQNRYRKDFEQTES